MTQFRAQYQSYGAWHGEEAADYSAAIDQAKEFIGAGWSTVRVVSADEAATVVAEKYPRQNGLLLLRADQ